MLILGVGAGLTFPTLSGAAVGSVPGPRFAVATSLNSVARQVGAALGVAILIAIIGTPTPLQALHAFEHGWLFAGGCFLVGALACTALAVQRRERPSDARSPGSRESRGVGRGPHRGSAPRRHGPAAAWPTQQASTPSVAAQTSGRVPAQCARVRAALRRDARRDRRARERRQPEARRVAVSRRRRRRQRLRRASRPARGDPRGPRAGRR